MRNPFRSLLRRVHLSSQLESRQVGTPSSSCCGAAQDSILNSWESMKNNVKNNLRTWIEISSNAARRNYDVLRRIVGPSVKLWVVVKSNAYGHGLFVFSKLMDELGVDGFCVDSLVEGIKLRKAGIKKPILVLGPTLAELYGEAAKNKITITVSNFEALKTLGGIASAKGACPSVAGRRRGSASGGKKATIKNCVPEFHVKIDTGMHRQGFYLNDLPRVIKKISNFQSPASKQLKGIYTHFASAKDINYPTYTEKQFAEFQKAVKLFERAGFRNLVKHCAATGATLINKKYHLDAVRLGIGLYGLWPSKELEVQLRRSDRSVGGRSPDQRASGLPQINLRPILSWKTVISEVKELNPGDYIGYDLTERALQKTKMAVLPIGYWHGYPRALSGIGEVIIGGQRRKVLGRVSMDLLVVECGRAKCVSGEVATLIGRDGKEELRAALIAQKAETTHYEFLTRLNPLIERVLV